MRGQPCPVQALRPSCACPLCIPCVHAVPAQHAQMAEAGLGGPLEAPPSLLLLQQEPGYGAAGQELGLSPGPLFPGEQP